MQTIIIAAAIAYLLLPLLLFFIGFLKIYFAIPLSVLFIAFALRLFLSLRKKSSDAFALHGHLHTNKRKTTAARIRKTMHSPAVFALLAFFALALWVILSGIGGFSYQNTDFFARNPIYRDLIDYPWPVIYDLSTEPLAVQSVLGFGTAAFAYYFCFWLPPAALSKLLRFGDAGRELTLYFWTFLGVLLIFACLTQLFRRRAYTTLLGLLFFGGLDILCFRHIYGFFRLGEHMEWWATYFQYSAQTTQLFWVFNQVIPVWLITSLFLLLSDNKNTAGLLSLSFAYSPWATIGLIPFGLAALCKKGQAKEAINPLNILVPISMAFVFGSFYLASSGSGGGMGLVFSLYPDATPKQILLRYLCFVLIEFGIYYLVAGPELLRLPYAKTTLLVLLVLPFLYIRDFNFTMRASTPALFVLMVGCIYALHEIPARQKWRRVLLAIVLIIGMGTSLSEVARSIQKRRELPRDMWRQESVYSLGQMRTDDAGIIWLLKTQFFVDNPDSTFFFRTLAK